MHTSLFWIDDRVYFPHVVFCLAVVWVCPHRANTRLGKYHNEFAYWHTCHNDLMFWCTAFLARNFRQSRKDCKVDGTFMQLASILKLETLVPIFKWLKKLKQCDIWTVLPLWTYLKKSTRTLLHLTLAVCEKSRRDKSKSYSYIFIFRCNQWLISLSIVTLKATGATGSCYVTQTLRRIDNEWRSLSDTAV